MEQPIAEPSQKIRRLAKQTATRKNSTGTDDNRSLLKCFECQVCGSKTLTKNFGAYACRACAAFFRRAIACGRKYKCKALPSCSNFASPELREPPFCKSCRLRKCFIVGMSPLEVRPLPGRKLLAAGADDDSLLGRTTLFRSVLFMRRLRLLTSEGADLMSRRYQRATTLTTVSANKAEIRLLRDFFSSSDALWSYLRSDISVNEIGTHFFLVWYILESLLATTRNFGYRRSRVFCTDDTYFDTTAEGLERDFASLPIRNKDVAARHAVEKWKPFLTLSEAIKLNNFDEFEISAILQLLFLKYGNLTRFLVKIVILESGFFSSDEAKRKFSNDVVGGLYAEYKRSSKDFTLSFDRVATILSAFHDVFRGFTEVMAMLEMYTPLEAPADLFVLVNSYRCRRDKHVLV
ncbi:zinc finger protein [Aphelenchoides avenae]|nr:zinc finger protein [Aphelenchus avenae]